MNTPPTEEEEIAQLLSRVEKGLYNYHRHADLTPTDTLDVVITAGREYYVSNLPTRLHRQNA